MSEEVEVVRHPRARRLKLAFDPASGRVRLVLPRRAPIGPAMEWVREQGEWIAAQRAKLPVARPFVDGATVPVGGVDYMIEWNERHPRNPRLAEGRIAVGGPAEGLAARIERWLRREALRVLAEETQAYAAKAGVTVARVGIGDPASRWGSCASTGTIRYSWRLILAPAEVRRATVAHEVAHRVHMNHSPAFHALVAELYGDDPTPHRRWLKANGAALHWYGRGGS
ncbi:M48 family metallopeptidase [Sphingomonas sp. RS2018]